MEKKFNLKFIVIFWSDNTVVRIKTFLASVLLLQDVSALFGKEKNWSLKPKLGYPF